MSKTVMSGISRHPFLQEMLRSFLAGGKGQERCKAGMIFFTDNYQDRSSDDGYQLEFFCRRCGNGYSSTSSTR